MTVTARQELLPAWRLAFFAPVASFRDPLFPGLSRGLPVPPPSTVRGLLAAATGELAETLPFGMAVRVEGRGIDAETYHPVLSNATSPTVGGRAPAAKGGMTLRDRAFLAGVHLTLWLPGEEGERIARALRRPRWALRLGRSQDLVHPKARDRVLLEPAGEAAVGYAVAPLGGHDDGSARPVRMAASVSPDRLATRWAEYLWCDAPGPVGPVRGAYRETGSHEGQAVWLLEP
ncbi:CRISPR-associated protein Cas5 [Streptomyces sp. NBRC 109706]|uniref:CRISPR-associated protein Cas5 n=1 Tax=Streptomyces sp. NBRC 109706 TaxID=1550035 RepID=UPI00099B2609|nr:CRISPR-associated protein Cas5 [Streptomyces sp. NBRC 109706]